MTKSDLPPSPTATFSSAFSSASSMTGRSIEYHDKDAILHQLRTLEAELRDTTDIGFDFTLTNSHEGEWWKKDAPPQELTLLTAEEPIELEAVVIAFYEVIESYTIARKEKEKEVALSKMHLKFHYTMHRRLCLRMRHKLFQTKRASRLLNKLIKLSNPWSKPRASAVHPC